MQTIRLEVEDSNLDIILTLIKNLKENIIQKYEVIGQTDEAKQFNSLSHSKLNNDWDNPEDAEYDRFLKI